MEIIECADAAEWERWLTENHEGAGEVWLRIAKKGAARASVTITEALDGALCVGWIDSHRRGGDGEHYLQRYSPRRARSPWSAVNVAKAEALIAAGRMQPAGFAAIEAARADGRWAAAYPPQRSGETHAALAAALADDPVARDRFDTLGRSARYGFSLRVTKARTDVGRANQVRKVLAELRA
ncbi:YdeI/OmpD-associated family protein [Nocardia harenae]|uniref:YdeI/OmpD-associated family protein n=1 Tax=Nocardia harenae TaxID=358707 RepID=UPI00082D530C|nr:YdeI/OmpD-associated family protein [Nocardia harenae]